MWGGALHRLSVGTRAGFHYNPGSWENLHCAGFFIDIVFSLHNKSVNIKASHLQHLLSILNDVWCIMFSFIISINCCKKYKTFCIGGEKQLHACIKSEDERFRKGVGINVVYLLCVADSYL